MVTISDFCTHLKISRILSVWMVLAILFFVCTEPLNLDFPTDQSHQQTTICQASDLLPAPSILERNNSEFDCSGLTLTVRFHRSLDHINLFILLEKAAEALFSLTGVLFLFFLSDRIRRFLTVAYVHRSDGQKSAQIIRTAV